LNNPAIRLERAEAFQIIYSNNAQISMSPFDLRIDFGETTSIAQDAVTVTQKVQIVMSPQHAAALLQALRAALDMAKSLNESGVNRWRSKAVALFRDSRAFSRRRMCLGTTWNFTLTHGHSTFFRRTRKWPCIST
jgi:hypothetical protein